MKKKVLNLYSGIGGNRKDWKNVEVTAVELNPEIARIYQDFFPDDKIIVGDAREYLVNHYKEFDFIWSSPPCQSHSKTIFFNHVTKRLPDFRLYEEIAFLNHFFYGKWVVENVKPYYEAIFSPKIVDRHAFWSNFHIPDIHIGEKVKNDKGNGIKVKMEKRDLIVKNWHGFKGDKRQVLNNCVYPKLGLHVFNAAFELEQQIDFGLFAKVNESV